MRLPDARWDAFAEHYAHTVRFTDELRETRCSRTEHFTDKLADTLEAFRPLFSPWNAEVLFAIYMHGPRRFNELKRGLNGISSRVLTDKLRHLEAHAFVSRAEEQESRAVTYTLTAHGEHAARLLHPLVFYLRNAPPE